MTAQDGSLSLNDVLASQAQLESEAAEAIPFSFSTCTYSLPEVEDRQPIYSCLSCRPRYSSIASSSTSTFAATADKGTSEAAIKDEDRAGICAGCSVACHGDCELVELFSRRNFVCDCGTTRLSGDNKGKGRKCTLTLRENEQPSEGNRYDKNFDGVFCECGIKYDPETEEDEMIQCLVCEDWYHLSKCLLSGFPASKDEEDDPFIHPDDFDQLVCERCVLSSARSTIGRYAGTKGFMLLGEDGRLPEQDAPDEGSKKEEHEDAGKQEEQAVEVTSKQVKRARTPDEETEDQASKRPKVEEDVSPIICQAPPEHNSILEAKGEISGSSSTRRKHVFLAEGWRERWCRCENCLPLYTHFPYLLLEESVYSPPTDPDSQKSLFDLGNTALSSMPHEQAIQGIEAYTGMRDALKQYLEPFAREGRVVGREDVKRFFEEQREQRHRGSA